MVLEISQNSQENTCARDSFLIKFELQHGLATPQIFFCECRVLQLLCHNVREPMISRVVKNSCNWNFANFRYLVLILPLEVFYKRGVLKNVALFTDSQENSCARLFFYAATLLKRDSGIGFFLWILQDF